MRALGRRPRFSCRALPVGAALLAALLLALPAAAERSQKGNLIVSVEGNISPLRLPRHRPAPVSLQLGGRIATADGSPLPRMRRIRLVIAGRGVLSTEGLPVCPRARLRNASTALALRRCRSALVGGGRLEADAFIANQKPFAIHADLLAFNGRTGCKRPRNSSATGLNEPPHARTRRFLPGTPIWETSEQREVSRVGRTAPSPDAGVRPEDFQWSSVRPHGSRGDGAFDSAKCDSRPAVWVHAFSANPPLAIILPFIVRRDGRRLQTSLTATVPSALGDLPHLASFELNLFRRYRHDGIRRSYLSASCPVPSTFTAGFLAFAKATYTFADGRQLRTEAVRSCRAR